jgi:AraC-like DNA-binding protein
MPATPLSGNHGLVRPWERNRSFILESRPPSPALERLVDRHWIVHWDLRGRPPFRQEILPHPSVNLVVEPQGASVWGVPTCRDVRLLHGRGWAVGTKFKPRSPTVQYPYPPASAACWTPLPSKALTSTAERLAGARAVPWTRLALELGYYDHAHFIRDFRLVVGLSPAEYASEAQSA